jgi:hypothetical protein
MARPSSRVCRVLMTGPLVPFADAFAAELTERGYAPLTRVVELRQVARLSRWLEAGGLSAADLNGERVEAFLAWQRAGGEECLDRAVEHSACRDSPCTPNLVALAQRCSSSLEELGASKAIIGSWQRCWWLCRAARG